MAVEGTAAAPSPTDAARRRLFRVAGIAGLAAVVLIFVAALVGTRQEHTFNSAAPEVLSYYQSSNTPGADFRSFVLTVGLITFVWFVVALTTLLRRAEGEQPWRSTIAMVSGVLLVAPVLSGREVAAAFRADDLDPQIARYAFDEAQAAFANARVALGSFAVGCGWVIVSTRFLPALAGMAGDREWSAARPQPHQLDQLHLPAALRAVLAVGTRRGRVAHAPRHHRWPTTTDRLSRTASGHDDAEPIATCGSSPLTEGLGPREASRK
jgi:hypothetical protein